MPVFDGIYSMDFQQLSIITCQFFAKEAGDELLEFQALQRYSKRFGDGYYTIQGVADSIVGQSGRDTLNITITPALLDDLYTARCFLRLVGYIHI